MSNDKVKTTILLSKTIKKLAQLHGLQNEMSLGDVIEEALRKLLVK